MSLTKVADSAEPFTVADAKTHLRETLVDATNDAYITGLITVVRQAAEERLERSLLETVWKLTLDAFPAVIVLERPPIQSVEWVKYVDSDGELQTLATTEYQVDIAKEPGRVMPAYGKLWPVTRPQLGAVTVQFKAGYASAAAIPTPIIQWMKLALWELYDHRSRSSERPALPNGFADQLLSMGQTVWSV